MVVTGLSSLSLHEAKATAATNKNTAIIFVFIFIIFYNDFGCKIMKNLHSGLISTSKKFNINTFITINYAKSTFVCQSKNDFIRVLIGLYELSC